MNQAERMLSALRSAGAPGMTRDELFDVAQVSAPSRACAELCAQGHSILDQPERVKVGPMVGITTRFTLMVDADTQEALFEGERTELQVLA